MASKENIITRLETDTDKVLVFPKGIPGFEKYTRYVVYHKEENGLSAFWLESCEEPKVTFTLVAPEQYGLSYDMTLSDEEKDLVQAEHAEDLAVFMILSKKEDENSGKFVLNANIIGPIIINPKTRLGVQKVLHRTRMQPTIVEDR